MREKPLILIVDDEVNFIEIIGAKLKSIGYDIVSAQNETEALKEVEAALPDLILMDIHMPGATGTDVALSLKQNPKTHGIKVAFLSSMKDPWPRTMNDPEKLSKALGMETYIQKTEDLNVIAGKVTALLGIAS